MSIEKQNDYPDCIRKLIDIHYSAHSEHIEVYYCSSIDEVKKYAHAFDLEKQTIREPHMDTKLIDAYYVAYGNPQEYRVDRKTGDLRYQSKGEFRIYYTDL